MRAWLTEAKVPRPLSCPPLIWDLGHWWRRRQKDDTATVMLLELPRTDRRRPGRTARLVGLAVMAPLAVAGCGAGGNDARVEGSGKVVTDERSIQAFQQVELAGEGRLLMSPDGPAALEVRTDDNLLPYIETEVVDGRLIISTRPDTDLQPSQGVTYRVRCDPLSEVVLSGSGDIDVNDCRVDDLAIRLDGSGSIGVEGIDATSVRAELAGSGTIGAIGRAGQLAASVDGSGTVDGAALEAGDVEARIPGSGRIMVWATNTLQASIAGSGQVLYRGDPAVTQDVSGSGAVTPLSDG
jgi:hypothetical protein